jgi:thioredoxin 1
MLQETNGEKFSEDIKEGDVIVDFWAEWCGPCRILHPVLEEIDQERNDLKIISLNIDHDQEIAVSFGVQSIPTLILFRGGEEIGRLIGAQPKRKLLEEFGNYFS